VSRDLAAEYIPQYCERMRNCFSEIQLHLKQTCMQLKTYIHLNRKDNREERKKERQKEKV
jgi:hypothetical protein